MSASTLELKQIFEYELRSKLAMKARKNTDEATLLINSLRFYDIYYTNTINLEQWSKSFSKLGLIGFTEKDMALLFDYYDYDKKGVINYKNFAYSLFNDNETMPSQTDIDQRKGMYEQYIQHNQPLKDMTPNQSSTPMKQQYIDPPSTQQYQPQTLQQEPMTQSQSLQQQQQQQQYQEPQPQQESSAYVSNTPLRNNIKRYFQSLLDIISQKININNGIGYFVFAAKLKESEIKLHKVLSYDTYLKCLREMQIDLTQKEAQDLFALLDLSDKKYISTLEFLRLLQKPISETRRSIIIDQFAKIDQSRRGQCEIEELKSYFNARNHPDVKYGYKTENEINQEFTFTLNTFIAMKDITRITIEDFIEYYSIISGSIDNDSDFNMILNTINSKTNYSNNTVISQLSQGKTPNLNLDVKEIDKKYEQIKYNPINNTYNVLDNRFNPILQGLSVNPYTVTPSPMPKPFSTVTGNKPIATTNYSNPKELISQTILKLRNMLVFRGAKGIFGLQRMFKLFDKQSTNKIHIADFDSLCQAYRLDLSTEEVNALFSLFDDNHTGYINYNAMVRLLTGEMNEARTNLVRKAFAHLDRKKTNTIDQNDLKILFNSPRHPDVVLAKRTQDEVLGEWLDNLDAFCLYNDIPLHQSLSFDQFMQFYSQISMAIDDERYFEYMVINVWNLDR